MRAVRQRCGYGCVICGIPLYEYDHLLGWANVQRHEVDEITLLCDRHHREKTNGLLPNEVVEEANKEPFNLRNGVTTPYALHYSGNKFEFQLGPLFFGDDDIPPDAVFQAVRIDGAPILAVQFEDGHYLLHMNLFDSANRHVVRIVENELVMNLSSWDIEFVGRTLTVREGHGNILMEIEFDAPNRVRVKRGRFLRNGAELVVRPEWVALLNTGNVWQDVYMTGFYVGITIGIDDPGINAIHGVEYVDRYVGRAQMLETLRRELAATGLPQLSD
jgi:hypothetical protein